MTDQTQTTTEPVSAAIRAKYDAVNSAAYNPGTTAERNKIGRLQGLNDAIAIAMVHEDLTTPQPLAIGLDREVRERLEKRIAEIDAHVARYPNSLDRNPATHAADLRSLLALAAPAEGWQHCEFVNRVGRMPHPADDDYAYPDEDDAEREALNGLIAGAREIMSSTAAHDPTQGARQQAIEDLVDAVHQVPTSKHTLELTKAVIRAAIQIMNRSALPAAPTGETGA